MEGKLLALILYFVLVVIDILANGLAIFIPAIGALAETVGELLLEAGGIVALVYIYNN